MKQEFDAIVIGSGSVGAPTAYFLAEAGLKVLAIDTLSSSGQGQTRQQSEVSELLTQILQKYRYAYRALKFSQVGRKKLEQILVGRKADIVFLSLERRKKTF